MSKLPLIDIFALGGTIAMAPDQFKAGQGIQKKTDQDQNQGKRPLKKTDGGVTPTLTADDLVRSIPQLNDIACIRAETLTNVASANLDFNIIKALCEKAAASDADAVVVTQGTDTMEETSFLAKLIYTGEKPLVFTGAMRSPDQLSSDGAANLYAAVLTAKYLKAPSVYVVMDNQVHDPVYVEKTHTWALDAFKSQYGEVGYVSENQVFGTEKPAATALDVIAPFNLGSAADIGASDIGKVAYLPISLGDDGEILDVLAGQYDGFVIDAYGAGHVSEIWAERIKKLARTVPVVLASQTQNGRVLEATYGYTGAEIDLLSNGTISAGHLSGKKARILLSLLISQKTESVKDSFTQIVEILRKSQ